MVGGVGVIIKTTLSSTFAENTWEKQDVTFERYKTSVLRHLGNLSASNKAQSEKLKIKQQLWKAQNLNEIKDAFSGTRISITVKYW